MSEKELADIQAEKDVEDSLDLQLAEFERDLHDFKRDIYKISLNISHIEKLTSQLDTAEDSHELRVKLNAIIESSKDLIKDLTERLHSTIPRQSSIPEVRKDQLRTIVREFNRLVEKFQKQQQVAISKTKLFVAQAENLASSSQSQLSQLEGPQGEQEPLLQQQKLSLQKQEQNLENEIAYNKALILERERGISEIQTVMSEVTEIFKDIGIITREQGELLDSIETQMEAAAQRTRNATNQLRIAEDYRRKRPYQYCWYIFLAILLTTILISLIISF